MVPQSGGGWSQTLGHLLYLSLGRGSGPWGTKKRGGGQEPEPWSCPRWPGVSGWSPPVGPQPPHLLDSWTHVTPATWQCLARSWWPRRDQSFLRCPPRPGYRSALPEPSCPEVCPAPAPATCPAAQCLESPSTSAGSLEKLIQGRERRAWNPPPSLTSPDHHKDGGAERLLLPVQKAVRMSGELGHVWPRPRPC